MVYYQLSRGRYVFDGDIVARSLTGKVVTAANLVTGSVTADILDAGSVTAEKLTADAIHGKTLRGGRVEMLGSSYMKVQASSPFGPDDLIEWYGSKYGNVNSSGDPIYGNLRKSNAIACMDDSGNVLVKGDISVRQGR